MASYQYSDFNIDFTRNEFVNDISMRKDVNSIRQSIANIILTHRGEKPFNTDFGVGLHHLLFEPLDPLGKAKLQDRIRSAVLRHEPRAEILSLDFSDYDNNTNTLNFAVNFLVLSGNKSNPIKDSLQISLIKVR